MTLFNRLNIISIRLTSLMVSVVVVIVGYIYVIEDERRIAYASTEFHQNVFNTKGQLEQSSIYNGRKVYYFYDNNGNQASRVVSSILFNSPLTSSSGWSGSGFTYSSAGATPTEFSVITTGASKWKPINSSNGQNIPLTLQATFTSPAIIPAGGNLFRLELWQDGGHRYFVNWNQSNNTLLLYKLVNTTVTVLDSINVTPTALTVYTLDLSLDAVGNLSTTLYLGTDTGLTRIQRLDTVDLGIRGNFSMGVGGDTGIVISNAKVIRNIY